ncbi:MAG: sulfotransferase [Paracoccaceae bacterium]
MANYGLSARVLHHLALSSAAMCEAQFDIECAIEKPIKDCSGRHVFVSGLARSGTTILMRSIFGTGDFATLTYRDMPFVMAPNLWSRLQSKSSRYVAAAERAHGDGIVVDADSPEALEEVFWRVFLGDQYLNSSEGLLPHSIPADVIDSFRKYVALIVKKADGTRYLSKNNNNILRIDGLFEAFPNAQVIIPFRHPNSQAQSLFKQHQMFSQNDDAFTHKYMAWLAHHEFGRGHRPFAFPEVNLAGQDPSTLPYWMTLWGGVYGNLISKYGDDKRVRFVCYETLSTDARAWNTLVEWLSLPVESASEFRAGAGTHPDDDVPTKLMQLFARLKEAGN